ncbi:putative 3-hydroxybutyryl-CoA dehydrogenase [Terricaulis silvestris]|uniref:Putative 3-hydroxybutyryl-CoA dehydrogenase n=2 Tax=Terricaulis silvestris TaxID=2686094 RepID=A0A6I6MU62_9CAUL|nr:putative 3-hydroxybutyryl-CoA dehydrogenase [Terricaulis silvestris]
MAGEMSTIRTVGVVGAGQMGNGIAHVCALAGYDVLLNDADATRIDAAIEIVRKNMARQVHREIIKQADMDAALKRIKAAPKLGAFEAVDLVIESVVEQDDAKKKVFADLRTTLKPTAILASNTSSISITRLAATTDRPDKFIGVHFMNPAPVMELVEIIRGLATSQETYDTSLAFIDSLGKKIANAEDFPAFIVNRVLVPMINEAVYTLYEGVGSVEAIDKAMKLGAHHPMGPLELADFIGLDTCLSIMQVLYEGLADSKYRPCPLLVKYVEAGWLGRKTERGFYDYRTDPPTPTR